MKQHRLAAAIALVGLVLAGCDSQTSDVKLETPAQKASYGIGLNMGKSLAQEGMDDLDPNAVAQGIEDAIGKKEQRLKDEELIEAFASLQKRAEERMTKMNEEAEAAGKKFLEENGKRDGVTTTLPPPLPACSTKWSRRPTALSPRLMTWLPFTTKAS